MKGFTFNAPANAGTQAAAPGAPKAGENKFGFGLGTQTSKTTEVFTAPIYVGMNQFSQNQGFQKAQQLEYASAQLTKSFGMDRYFLQPVQQAKPATTTFGAAAKTAPLEQYYGNNINFSQLQSQKISDFNQLNEKLQQTLKDTEQLNKNIQVAQARMQQISQNQAFLYKQTNDLIDVQQIIKVEFFKHFPMQNYNADVKLQQLTEKMQEMFQQFQLNPNVVSQNLQQISSQGISLKAQQLENEVVDLIKITQQ